MSRYAKSQALLRRAEKVLAGGVSSNVRRGDKPFPLYYAGGSGPYLSDADGNRYVDYVLGRGPLILGHSQPDVLDAACAQLNRGQIYAAQHEAEIELAERVTRIVPSAELVRFGISGSEAVHAALRLARAFSGRPLVVKFEGHYHGWLDNILYSLAPDPERAGDEAEPRALPETAGQPAADQSGVVVLPWNNPAAPEAWLAKNASQTAAIITEPIMCNTGVIPPKPGYLEALRYLCSRKGIVLIFDEVITGFRVSLSGAQGHLGIRPDLSVFGKAIANGFPLSCLAGRADIMGLIAQGKVGHGGTYNSIPPSVAAGVTTLDLLARDGGAAYGRIAESGAQLMHGFRNIARRLEIPLIVQGHPSVFYVGFPKIGQPDLAEVVDYRTSLRADQALYDAFVCALSERGVRVIPRGNWFLSAAHTQVEIDATLKAAEEAMSEVAVPHYAKAGARPA